MILLDTHVLLWLDREDPALGPTSRELILTAWGEGSVAVCAITVWEVAMLALRGRIDLRQSPESWRLDWLQAGLVDVHPDPADRFIVATALAQSATLVTADQAILGWSGPLLRQPAGR